MPIRKRPPLSSLYQDMLRKIEQQRLHHSQRLPGMTPEEVKAEMLECVWKAWDTYRASQGVPIEKYFWRIWIHRRSDLLTYYFRQRRDIRQEVLVETADQSAVLVGQERPGVDVLWPEEIPPVPAPAQPDEQSVWVLLAHGYTRTDVLEVLAISKRRYYEILQRWRDLGPVILTGD